MMKSCAAAAFGGVDDLLLARPFRAVGDVGGDRVVEEHRVLRQQRRSRAHAGDRRLPEILPVDQDAAARGIEEAQDEVEHGALPGAARPDERELASGGSSRLKS